MELIIAFFVFAFGVVIGSFLNVVILRYNTGTSIASGRSFCFTCGKTLHWYELVPLFSFLAQGGRCRGCKSKISWQYPLVEFTTGVLFALTFLKLLDVPFGKPLFLFYCLIESLLIVISVYDIRHKIIPDGLVYAFAFFSLANLVFEAGGNIFQSPHLYDLLAGPILFLPFFLLWFISKGTWMGLGDGKLALGIGWFLGLARGVSAIFLGFWIGAGVSIVLLVLQKVVFRGSSTPKSPLLSGLKNLTMKSEIPFGPFLILGTLIVFFFGIDVVGLKYFLL